MTYKPAAVLFFLFSLGSQSMAADQQPLKNQLEKVNYAIGVNLINNLRQQGVEIDIETLIRGVKDSAADGELLLSGEELRKATVQYQTLVRQKQGAKAKTTLIEKNKMAADRYLAENKKKAGVVTLPDGIQYTVLVKGTGRLPTDADTVEYNYRGRLPNGKEFDSSYRTNKPAVTRVQDVAVKGLAEVLKLMPQGSRWLVVIPSQLAYGDKGDGREIGPGQLVIYELEMVAIK